MRLVTSNAKTFNPPGTIYYTEAERIEAYALDHITKASATVIEYETDWNIDVEKDDELVAVDDDDATGTPADRATVPGTPMDVDESRAGSPSVVSVQLGTKGKKGKKVPGTLTESLEPDGGLPGAKDGLGAFPPGSDWAELMLALKIKGALPPRSPMATAKRTICAMVRQAIPNKEGTHAHGEGRAATCCRWQSRLPRECVPPFSLHCAADLSWMAHSGGPILRTLSHGS